MESIKEKNILMKFNKPRFYSKLFQQGQNYSNRRERLKATPLEQKAGDFQTHLFCGPVKCLNVFCFVFFPQANLSQMKCLTVLGS